MHKCALDNKAGTAEEAVPALLFCFEDILMFLFLETVSVAAHELVYAASCVDQFLLTSEERVRRTRDFEFYERVSNAVDFDCLLSSDSRASDESFAVRHIFENNLAIV